MYDSTKKGVLLGLDSVNLELVRRFVKEGYLPNMKCFMEEGTMTKLFTIK